VSDSAAAPNVGIVLSGGGMRGAYEVGVVTGIVEVLGCRADDPALFRVFSGTSVGAINAAYLAATAHRGDHAVDRLVEVWTSLRLEEHTRIRPLGLVRGPKRLRRAIRQLTEPDLSGSSLLDPHALEQVVRRSVDWPQLHENVRHGRVRALLVAALHVASGRTTIFAEVAPGATFNHALDDRRTASLEPIEAEHVLASAAIPLLFPTRRVKNRYYCDGGLRFNTPIAPAIRAGADRLLVISVRHHTTPAELAAREATFDDAGRDLTPIFLLGKLLNALLLDPVMYDLQVLERLNQLMEVVEETLGPDEMKRLDKVLIGTRGAAYRRIRTLVFTPSKDLGRLAGDYIRTSLNLTGLAPLARFILQRAANDAPNQEVDWASYLLFDGGFAARLIELGRADALQRADDVKRFFGD
jgi:NTE family protein